MMRSDKQNAAATWLFSVTALLLAVPSYAGTLPEAFLGEWGSIRPRADAHHSGQDVECIERARITDKSIDRDALGSCEIDDIKNDLDADEEWDAVTIKVTLSCDGMYNPLKQIQIWSAFLLKGDSYMTQTTVKIIEGYEDAPKPKLGEQFSTTLLKKCETLD